ncbi:Beta-parvin [Eumeta japonica]|uniref:Beta-parvin n=1 Tax=Eumeta variegata TaxID=151549 RepID=A0A4C2AEM7_EUMVA|nr:Beta-parvin [Eumeta japonica]
MSTLNRPKSPNPIKANEKEESFWDKFSTLGRKKGTKEGDHEQRAVIDPQSINDPEVVKLQQILIDWINDELAEQRIIVQSIDEDMYDGQDAEQMISNVAFSFDLMQDAGLPKPKARPEAVELMSYLEVIYDTEMPILDVMELKPKATKPFH